MGHPCDRSAHLGIDDPLESAAVEKAGQRVGGRLASRAPVTRFARLAADEVQDSSGSNINPREEEVDRLHPAVRYAASAQP